MNRTLAKDIAREYAELAITFIVASIVLGAVFVIALLIALPLGWPPIAVFLALLLGWLMLIPLYRAWRS